MEKISNDKWAFSPGINLAGKAFVEKWLELLNPLTVDNYRVRHLNTRVAFEELREVIREAENKTLEAQNIEDVSKELLGLLKVDPVAQSSLPHHEYYYNSLLNPFKEKERSAHPGLKVLVKQACDVLEKRYRIDLIDALAVSIQGNVVGKTVALTSLLVSDLIASGYDFRHLLWRGRSFINSPTHYFLDRLSSFLNQFKAGALQKFLVAYRIDFPNVRDATSCPTSLGGLKVRSESDVASDHPNLRSHIPGPNVRLATLTTDAFDPFAATRNGSSELHKALDIIQFTKPSVEIISHNTAYVVLSNGTIKSIPTALELLGPIKIADDEVEHRINQLARIRQRVDGASVRQLGLGLQYLRRGLTESAPQGQFLNYWIGLEAIAGGARRTEITTTRRSVSKILALGYPRRLIRDLQENFNRLDVNVGTVINPVSTELYGPLGKLEALLRCISNAQSKVALLDLAGHSPLLISRIEMVEALLGKAGSVVCSMENHRQDVDWHIQRLYRIRNAIVHGGGIPSDLTHLASNLATYLWVILRSLLDDFGLDGGTTDITMFFDKHLKIHEMLLRKIEAGGRSADLPFAMLIEPTRLWPAT
ncbi:MAG: hypothetical protein HOP35_15335 [Nitrospira sp.]|nr:hypothetical protein [Nitrospira sp.]